MTSLLADGTVTIVTINFKYVTKSHCFYLGVVVMNPLAVYLDEHEAHSWRDTLKILGGAIACAGIFYLATLIRPLLFGINDSEYEVNKT